MKEKLKDVQIHNDVTSEFSRFKITKNPARYTLSLKNKDGTQLSTPDIILEVGTKYAFSVDYSSLPISGIFKDFIFDENGDVVKIKIDEPATGILKILGPNMNWNQISIDIAFVTEIVAL